MKDKGLRTVDEFEKAFMDLLGEYSAVIARVGELVVQAGKTLLKDDYELLIERLKDHGWTDSLFQAARKVHEGGLLPQLIVANVPVSKIVGLSMLDQKRLVSGETFMLKRSEGPNEAVAWKDMDADERNQLLGHKGGHILTPKEQKVPVTSREQINLTTFSEARFDRHEQKFSFCYKRRAGEITLGDLMNSLLDKGELDAADAAWQAKLAELKRLREEEDAA